MSADNWAICPKCNARKLAVRNASKQAAEDAYGKAPPSEYLELLRIASLPVTREQTLREDYGIGIDDEGNFSVDYQAGCACGFTFRFTHSANSMTPQ